MRQKREESAMKSIRKRRGEVKKEAAKGKSIVYLLFLSLALKVAGIFSTSYSESNEA